MEIGCGTEFVYVSPSIRVIPVLINAMHRRQAGIISDHYRQHVQRYKRRHSMLEAATDQMVSEVNAVFQVQAGIAMVLERSCENLVAVCRDELGHIEDELRYLTMGAITLPLRLR